LNAKSVLMLLLVLPLSALPVTGAVEPEPQVKGLVPDILDLTGALDLSETVAPEHVPAPDLAAGVGPGTALIISRPDGTFGCTANFIWESGGVRYLGAAGHCFLPADKTSTHGSDADYSPASTSVRACFATCVTGGQTGFIINGPTVALGSLVYARQSADGVGPGSDFGLVRIPTGVTQRPSMPMWGGPVGVTKAALGMPVCFFGNGIGYGETVATKGRAGVALWDSVSSYTTIAPTSSGDSGMAVVRCGTDATGAHGYEAIGIHTHSQVVTAVPGLRIGTTIVRAQAMASEAGLSITLVNGA
jgi:hypothetical protein